MNEARRGAKGPGAASGRGGGQGERRGFGLVEVLVVALILSTCTLAYLTLMGRQIRWADELEARARAVTLARNLSNLAGKASAGSFSGSSIDLFAGIPPEGGERVVDDVLATFPGAALALGVSLRDWARKGRVLASFHLLRKAAAAGRSPLGILHCTVTWKSTDGRLRKVTLSRVVASCR